MLDTQRRLGNWRRRGLAELCGRMGTHSSPARELGLKTIESCRDSCTRESASQARRRRRARKDPPRRRGDTEAGLSDATTPEGLADTRFSRESLPDSAIGNLSAQIGEPDCSRCHPTGARPAMAGRDAKRVDPWIRTALDRVRLVSADRRTSHPRTARAAPVGSDGRCSGSCLRGASVRAPWLRSLRGGSSRALRTLRDRDGERHRCGMRCRD